MPLIKGEDDHREILVLLFVTNLLPGNFPILITITLSCSSIEIFTSLFDVNHLKIIFSIDFQLFGYK